jgi:hypothetical protein
VLGNNIFGLKYSNSLMRIRDPCKDGKNLDRGSGMEKIGNIPDPQHWWLAWAMEWLTRVKKSLLEKETVKEKETEEECQETPSRFIITPPLDWITRHIRHLCEVPYMIS